MFALKEFSYQNRETRQSVTIHAGQAVDPAALARHGCDIGKLERVKFVAREDAPSESSHVPKKRGRPKKSA